MKNRNYTGQPRGHELLASVIAWLRPGVLMLLAALPWLAQGQLTITNGVQTYSALAGATVNLSGSSELRVTSSSTPLSGCIINLNSPDTALVLAGIKPSAVVSTYLGQVRVNGGVAVAESNCRVVEYAMGTIVVPHAASLPPLQAFSAPCFTGVSHTFGQHVYYKGSGLGGLNGNLRSFKLKRGYAVTFAEQENGSGRSYNYVAQDGDLEMGILPNSLDGRVRFVYVVPWRWAGKKGIAGNIESGLNLQWKYNWNIDQNSTRDLEYVPIRQSRWWPGLGQDWKARGSSQLLGYNEPDRPDQANMAVSDAINSWPDLLGTGLRLGAPAVSDGGRSGWLYPFMTQADAANLRVDFVPIHYYWCASPVSDPNAAANQMYNFLKATYDQVKRPLWITEWNNGANWTGCGDPTFAQQQAAISAIITMLDNTPFVERYAPYNWVEDVRRLKWDDGSLTSAGVTYRDKQSPIAYQQALQDNGTRSFAQLSFDGNAHDRSGYGNNGVTTGTPAYTNGVRGQALVFDGANTHVTLPPNIARSSSFTFAAWVYWRGGGSFQRIFDFGNSTTEYLYLTPSSSGGTLRFGTRSGSSTEQVETSALPVNQWRHVAVTLSGSTARLYLNGTAVATNTSFGINPATFSPRVNYLGKSQWPSDPNFNGLLDEVLITDYALSAAQLAALQTNTPPAFTANVYYLPQATNGVAYSGTLDGFATDPDAGDTISFSRPTGPSWLEVASDGTLSGTPTSSNGGTNWFTVRAVDAAGDNSYAVVAIPVLIINANGTWAADASDLWSNTNRWVGGTVATGPGQAANFSTININAHRTAVLNTSRSIGTLRFGDTTAPFYNWTISSLGGSVLTLDSGSSASPAIVVTNTATLTLPLDGVNGFTKSGPGTLILSGNNALSGTVNIDTSSTTLSDGTTRLVGPGALGNVTLLQIRNNNSGSSTLELDGATGSISVDADVSVTCRNNGVISILNLAGTNVFNGDILLNVGGNSHTIQSDANSLIVFTGDNKYVGSLTGSRTYYFTGAGDHLLVGPLLNSTNGAPIAMAKSGAGTLTLEAVNTFANGTTLSGGRLVVNGTLPPGAFSISGGTTLGGSGLIYPAVNLPSGATLAPGASIGKLTVNNSVTLQPGSVTRMEISKHTGAAVNDQLRVTGTLTYGGTLVVTNLGGTLWAGDVFPFFTASSTGGAFAGTNLPALPGGLAWVFDGTNGLLRVVEPGTSGVSPMPPFALTAAAGNGVVNLAWVQSPTADVVTNRIYRSTAGIGGPFNLLASLPAAVAYADAAVGNGQAYDYVVTAVSTNGESVWSGFASATPQALSPNVADADTLILFHFDEPAGTSAVTNYGTLSSSAANRRAYTVDLVSATTTPPLVTSVLGAAAYPAFGSAANLSVNGRLVGWDANDSGAYDADAGSAPIDAVPFSTFNFGNGGQSAWTMEALIFPTNATASQPWSSEIICTDSSAASRGFQFRLTTSGQLELNFISGSSGGAAQQLVNLPASGPHAYAASNWFHVAATYNGTNVSLYWSRLDALTASANLLTNYPLTIGPTFGGITGPLVVGGENRGANTESFPGLIDEVRISSVARTATSFLKQSTLAAPAAPQDLGAGPSDGLVELGWSLVGGATSYNVKRVTTIGAAFTTITNVGTTAFTDLGLVNGLKYYYVVSALNAAGESINSSEVSAQPLSLVPPTLAAVQSGNQLQFFWPADHTGWRLEVQTNSLATGLDLNWFEVTGSSTTNSMSLPLDSNQHCVFYRLVFP